MHKMLIHYYVDMGMYTHKSNGGTLALKATQELFLQGWANRIFCLAVFSTPFPPSIVTLSETLREEDDESEVEKFNKST